MYEWFHRNFLSKMDPEKAHNLALYALKIRGPMLAKGVPADERLRTKVAGIQFSNPLGMAAGFDKKAEVFPALFRLGFGHVEVGTTTLFPRKGKPKPRIWRLPNNELFNSMGLPGPGVDQVVVNILKRRGSTGVLGASISPTNEDFYHLEDYEIIKTLFHRLHMYVDYITINISCPNVNEEGIYNVKKILETISNEKKYRFDKDIPVFVKLRPPVSFEVVGVGKKPIIEFNPDPLKYLIDVFLKYNISGVILSNTLGDVREIDGKQVHGGRSGPFLAEYNLEAVRTAYNHSGGELSIIGVGGIESAEDMFEYIANGASLVQLYTGFVNHGPRLPAKILTEMLDKLGERNISEIVGMWS